MRLVWMTTLGPPPGPAGPQRPAPYTGQPTRSSRLFGQLRIPRKALELHGILTYPLIFFLNKGLPILRGQKPTGVKGGSL